MEEQPRCAVCDGLAVVARIPGSGRFRCTCKACGEYIVSAEWALTPPVLTGRQRFLAQAIRQASDRGNALELNLDNWEALAGEHREVSVELKLEKLLQVLARKTTPGKIWSPESNSHLLVDAEDSIELEFLISALVSNGFATRSSNGQPLLTAAGWSHARATAPGGIPGRCFVAMAFRPRMARPYHDGIRAAVEDDCGFTAVRMLELEHNDKICDRIIVEVRRAQFVVADFTFQRGGVYFEEIGRAHV